MIILLLTTPVNAQQCKSKIVVAYWDGMALQIGLTGDQAKFWGREKTKRYPALCLDGKAPDYVIAWTDRASTVELRKTAVHRGTGGSDPEKVIAASASQAGDSAQYFIFDLSQDPAQIIHTGSGAKSSPIVAEQPPGLDLKPLDKGIDLSRTTSTAPDPVEAMKNALAWLKKKR
ncbi:MAG: hypothetical protein ACRD5M_00175 [Candidatus Acidiferrales bacterium]